jgi:5-methyltetrahydropteroyltriglutamate--homocysteine methyltransferase
MSVRTAPPFRADHVGSLLRPPALMAAREQHARGTMTDDALREVEDASIRDAVRLQQDVGLQSATDGEFRRTAWHMDFIYQLEGIDRTDQQLMVHFRNEAGELDFSSAALQVHDRISLGHTIFGDAFTFLRDTVGGTTAAVAPPSTRASIPTSKRSGLT